MPEEPAPSASAPSERQIEDGADKSAVEHDGHGDATSARPAAQAGPANAPEVAGTTGNLAATGGDGSIGYVAAGGAALALGAAVLFAGVSRRGGWGR